MKKKKRVTKHDLVQERSICNFKEEKNQTGGAEPEKYSPQKH